MTFFVPFFENLRSFDILLLGVAVGILAHRCWHLVGGVVAIAALHSVWADPAGLLSSFLLAFLAAALWAGSVYWIIETSEPKRYQLAKPKQFERRSRDVPVNRERRRPVLKQGRPHAA